MAKDRQPIGLPCLILEADAGAMECNAHDALGSRVIVLHGASAGTPPGAMLSNTLKEMFSFGIGQATQEVLQSIQIDVGGQCGSISCSQMVSHSPECLHMGTV